MVSQADNADSLPPSPGVPKTLKGVGMVIAVEQEDGRLKALGTICGRTVEDIREIFRLIHGQKITVNENIVNVVLEITHPPKK